WKADGSVSYSDLFRASSVLIRRHVKVQQAATAFDPAFREYFQKLRKTRAQVKGADHVGSFRASAAHRRSQQPRPGRVTAASGKAGAVCEETRTYGSEGSRGPGRAPGLPGGGRAVCEGGEADGRLRRGGPARRAAFRRLSARACASPRPVGAAPGARRAIVPS